MIAARDGAICDECVGLCLGILAKDSDLFEATIEQARTVAALIDEAGASEPAI